MTATKTEIKLWKRRQDSLTYQYLSRVPSHPFLVEMIAVSVSVFKLEPFIPTGLTNDFLLFDPFIVPVFGQHVRTKAATSHLFTPLFMFIHLPLIHFDLYLYTAYAAHQYTHRTLPSI